MNGGRRTESKTGGNEKGTNGGGMAGWMEKGRVLSSELRNKGLAKGVCGLQFPTPSSRVSDQLCGSSRVSDQLCW